MVTHIQGVAILILVMVMLFGIARLVAPVFEDALGEEGAIIARSPDEENTSTRTTEFPGNIEVPLTFNEVSTLQWLLVIEEFLGSPSDIDGVVGPITEDAINRAKASFGIPAASNRVLLARLEERHLERSANDSLSTVPN